MDTIDQIKKQIETNSVLIFMKGTPRNPQCGFSARSAQILIHCSVPFSYVDVLANPDIRAKLPEYAEWPTFPQLWINGELIGGCDIITQLFESGELKKMLGEVDVNNAPATDI